MYNDCEKLVFVEIDIFFCCVIVDFDECGFFLVNCKLFLIFLFCECDFVEFSKFWFKYFFFLFLILISFCGFIVCLFDIGLFVFLVILYKILFRVFVNF